ncbi:transketolase [Planctomycetota bacterium]
MTAIARKIRVEALKMIAASPGGHPGGALSMAEILAALYFRVARVRPSDPAWSGRDRIVLSKGHACASYYAALGMRGYFDAEEFRRFRRIDGLLEGHSSVSVPGVDAPSGSLGMGLSQALGMALGARVLQRDCQIWVILGDGDMQEGATWEALMAAGHHRVGNLCAVLDHNGLQQHGSVANTMDYSPIAEKVRAFRWHMAELDGHDSEAVVEALNAARKRSLQPTFIVARTVKGKGVSFMENQAAWHGTVTISPEELQTATQELQATS